MWINKFKIAIANKETEVINELLNEVPEFTKLEDSKTALFLMREAIELLYTLQDEASSSMTKIKNNINFLQSSLSDSTGRLNIKL
jgi:hypothetical protein